MASIFNSVLQKGKIYLVLCLLTFTRLKKVCEKFTFLQSFLFNYQCCLFSDQRAKSFILDERSTHIELQKLNESNSSSA